MDLDRAGQPRPDRPRERPQPWLAAATTGDCTPRTKWDPWKFDSHRADRMRREDLCQVCGVPRSDIVYVLAPATQVGTLVEMYGGAVCSLRCARLTAAVCPHYTTAGSPTLIYAVARHERVDLVGCDLANDDEYDICGLTPAASISTSPSTGDITNDPGAAKPGTNGSAVVTRPRSPVVFRCQDCHGGLTRDSERGDLLVCRNPQCAAAGLDVTQ
ncbi:hypothetical protein [Amycolatopsis nalaikhensis]|uniref:Uncharacterized protein n=1 Tax=Amycolatopsis nalaikhensis TaxID=715472 RepID=A0ABY8X950_9PSEU|nr:hypothetical protein [Amycolatopsis sp. 2-2]WIV52934.1 hypothetical protein QP939_28770 [Amycolatopsis sp. 2-2]